MSVLKDVAALLRRLDKSKKLRDSPAIKPLIARLRNYISPSQSGGGSTPSSVDVSPDESREIQVPTSAINVDQRQVIMKLWGLSGAHPETFVQYLYSYPDPGLRQSLKRPGALESIIRELRQRGNPSVKGDAEGFPPSSLPSSNVKGFRYNPRSRDLEVKFQGGQIYRYNQVPPMVYKLFATGSASARTRGKNKFGEWWPQKSPSMGAAVWQYLRAGGFPYQKIN